MATDKADTLALILRVNGLTNDFQREYMFAPPAKRSKVGTPFRTQGAWRVDFMARRCKLAIEVDGGQWKAGGGRHNTDTDREKMNALAAAGIRVLHFSPAMLQDPDGVVRVIRAAMEIA